MITAVKQLINGIYMYCYLLYYDYKLETNWKFRVVQSVEHMTYIPKYKKAK